MTAYAPRIIPGIEPGAPTRIGALARGRLGAVAAFFLGFLAFLPYPAIPAGGNSALQMGSVLSLLLIVPIIFMSWKKQPFYLYVVIHFPLVLSAMKVAMMQQAGMETCFKTVITWAIPCMTLMAAQLYIPRFSLQVFTGIACVTIIHVLVGVWQLYTFATGGELPLLFLYVNPSYFPLQSDVIVRYIQRPFGLFPEPSAMSSSLAPFVLLWSAELCGLVKFARQPSRMQRILFTIAAVGALMLIISSRSGHSMVTLAGLCVFGIIWLKNARATFRNYFLTVFVFGVILPLAIWMTFLAVGDRVAEAQGANESWQDRSNSLRMGFVIWSHGDLPTLLFGIGNGLSAEAISSRYGLEAVWSVLLTYIYEAGLVGLAAVVWVGVYLGRIWRYSGFSIVFAVILFVWLVGVTVTTSYNQLLPIWLTLGFLTVWPEVVLSQVEHKPKKAPAFAAPATTAATL